LGDCGVGGEVGVDDGEAGAPFEVGDEGGAELGIGGELKFVGGFEEEPDPALALLLGDVLPRWWRIMAACPPWRAE
jgi:hypothetical protein